MILMLDFDGVLHPDPCYDESLLFSKLPLLEDVLRAAPNTQVVISSSWKEKRSLVRLKALFSDDVASRVIDVTPDRADFPEISEVIGYTYRRQIEIEAWLRMSGRPWENWIALDDRAHWFKPFLKNLLLCDSKTGIDEYIADLLLNRLLHES